MDVNWTLEASLPILLHSGFMPYYPVGPHFNWKISFACDSAASVV
jgi:hypothetical protein